MKSRRGRVILGIVVLLVVGGVIAFAYFRANAQAPSTSTLQTTTVTRGTISSSVVAAGTINARQSATLNWQAEGNVGTIDVQVGQVVTAGQVLATLSSDAIPQNVISAQADLLAAQQALKDLMNSTTAQAQALQTLQNAQTALNNYQNNFPATQAQAQADLTTAQNNLAIAQNRREAMNSARASQADINAAQAAYDRAVAAVKAAQAVVDGMTPASTDPQYTAARANLAKAENTRNAALVTLQWYLGKPNAQDIANADTAVAQAQSALAQAQQAWDLVKDGPDPTQLALLQAQLSDAQRAYALVQNGPNPDDVAAAKARIAGDQATINTMKITAPFSGTVTEVSNLPNDQVSSGTAAFRIDDLSHLEVNVSIAEIDIPKIQVGMPAEMTFDALGSKTYNGKVTEVSPVGTTTQGVVNFGVTVELTNPDKNVLPGMTAAVNIITSSKQNVLLLTNRAIHTTGGQHVVTVLSEGNLVNVPVTLGLTNDTESEIASGNIHEGDTVVLNASVLSTTTNNRGGVFGFFGRILP
jgi:HlyD family secretion protein